jgi:hypothetical protein
VDEELERCVAATDDRDDIAEDGAGERGDDSDAAGKGRQRAFAGGVEEAFGEEAGFELLEGQLEAARSARLDSLRDELKLAPGLIDGDATADENCQAVCRAEAKQLGFATEQDDGELGVGVLQGEVDVS